MSDEPLTKENKEDEIARVAVTVEVGPHNPDHKEIYATPLSEPPEAMVKEAGGAYRDREGNMTFTFSSVHAMVPDTIGTWQSLDLQRTNDVLGASPFCLVLQRRGFIFYEYEYYVVHDPAGPTHALTMSYSEKAARQQYIDHFMLEPEDIDRLGPITVQTWDEHMKDKVAKARDRVVEHFTGIRPDSADYSVEMDEFIGPAL